MCHMWFWKQSYSQNSRNILTYIYSMPQESRSNPRSKEQQHSPTSSAKYGTSLLHDANMWICGLYLHVTLVHFTTVQMNEIEPTRPNPAVFPKIATWKSLRLRSKNTSWCRIGKWHCLKTCRFKTPTCFFRHPRRIFLENFENFRVTAESAGALRDGANVMRTQTGNYFCVQICYKFPISDCTPLHFDIMNS